MTESLTYTAHKQSIRRHPVRCIMLVVLFTAAALIGCGLLAAAADVHAQPAEATPVTFEATQAALATAEALLGCDVRYVVNVRAFNAINGLAINGLNVRSAPVSGEVVGAVNSNSGELHAVELRDAWYRLCSSTPVWVSGSSQYVTAATVTPSPTAGRPTTAAATSAPAASPTRYATAVYPECEVHVRGGPTYRVPGWCDAMAYWTVQTVPTAWNRSTPIPEP